MPHFRDALERVRYMESEGIAADVVTALMIGEPKPKKKRKETVKDGSDRKSADNSEGSEG